MWHVSVSIWKSCESEIDCWHTHTQTYLVFLQYRRVLIMKQRLNSCPNVSVRQIGYYSHALEHVFVSICRAECLFTLCIPLRLMMWIVLDVRLNQDNAVVCKYSCLGGAVVKKVRFCPLYNNRYCLHLRKERAAFSWSERGKCTAHLDDTKGLKHKLHLYQVLLHSFSFLSSIVCWTW